MTTLRFPDEVPVSGEILIRIAAMLGIPAALVMVDSDDTPAWPSTGETVKYGWDYERPEPFDERQPDGVIGYALGSRWRARMA
jgi:hypothetical protein